MLSLNERYITKKNEEGKRLAPTGVFSDDDYKVCQHPWPDECFVQCGEQGIVFTKEEVKRTAFFEAFPKSPDTFLRGEGETVEAAEESCWKKYQRILTCSLDHSDSGNFDARGYTNGYGFCKNCGMGSSIIPPIHPCQNCGELTWYSQDINNDFWCKKCYNKMPKELWNEIRAKLAKEDEEEGYVDDGNDDEDDD